MSEAAADLSSSVARLTRVALTEEDRVRIARYLEPRSGWYTSPLPTLGVCLVPGMIAGAIVNGLIAGCTRLFDPQLT